MRLPAEQILFVGDSAIDVETARLSGMRSAAVTWGYCEREALIAARPDVVIDHPAQLLTLDMPHID
jgi:phosphoglycolate phosphatase